MRYPVHLQLAIPIKGPHHPAQPAPAPQPQYKPSSPLLGCPPTVPRTAQLQVAAPKGRTTRHSLLLPQNCYIWTLRREVAELLGAPVNRVRLLGGVSHLRGGVSHELGGVSHLLHCDQEAQGGGAVEFLL